MSWAPAVSVPPATCEAWWQHRARRYEVAGPPGLTETSTRELGQDVAHLLWRDDDGVLRGVLTHYPTGLFARKRSGEVDLAVDPAARRQGIGRRLLDAGIERWDIQAKRQRYTPDSAALTEAWLRDNRREGVKR